MTRNDAQTAAIRQRRMRTLVAASIVIGAVCATAISLLALDVLSASRAYVAGESRWSKAQQEAVFHLDRYAETGDSAALRAAREALAVPLGDRQARLALERDPPDLAAAREGLAAGANHPDDIPRMIRLFRHFRGLEHFGGAVLVWREADSLILELESLADRLQSLHAETRPDPARVADLRAELAALDARLRPMANAFSRQVSAGARTLSRHLGWLAVILILVASGSLFWVFRWALARIGRSEIKLRTTFQHAPVGMATIDPGGAFREVNDTLCSILGRGRSELLQARLADVAQVEDRELPGELIDQCNERHGRRVSGECRFAKADRSVIWARVNLAPVRAATGNGGLFILVMEDVSESHRLAQELAYQASHDQLTGLPNRREFERHLDQVLSYSRAHGTHHALCLVDLDQFKVVNDTIGHAAGDSLLVRVAEQMQRHLRPADILARLGGDEFGVILVDCNMEIARRVAERLRAAITNFRFYWEDRVITVSGSIGLVELSPESADASRVLQTADVACYLAKEQGRNRIYLHTEEKADSARRQDEMAWVSRLNDALSGDALRFHAQMIMPLVKDHDPRCELLVRMLGQDGKLYPAGEFIAAAERFNAARSLDRWVVDNALARIRRIEEDSETGTGIGAWHINLSGQSIDCEEVLPEILEMIRRHGVAPERICFEITESAAVYSLEEAEQFFGELRRLGCQVALDDFGKGLSSFNYLKRLPVDFVKIDGSFVRELGHNELDHAMVRSIREIAHIAGKQTIAECVESVETRVRLQQLEIDFAQGYAIHVPCPLEELELSRPQPLDSEDAPRRRREDD